jgi:shikimate kinase
MNLIFVGPMGSGKSTVGRLAAAALSRPFVDTDEWIEGASGRSVAELFAREGEDGFRERETAALEAVLGAADSRVVATGGGIVVRAENRALLRAGGLVILLWAEAEALWRRLAAEAAVRPRLAVADPVAVLRGDLETRGPWYREVAGLILDEGSAQAAAERAVAALRRAEAGEVAST